MHFGFDSCSGPTPSLWSNPRFVLGEWFKDRHNDSQGTQHARECIREQIKKIRKEGVAWQAGKDRAKFDKAKGSGNGSQVHT